MKLNKKNNGFTLIEMEIAVAIFGLIAVAVSSFIVYIYKTERHNLSQLEAVNSARRALELVSAEIRNARQAETGAYTIDTADSQSLILYSDDDNDDQTEKVRYFLDNKQFKKGVIEPPYTVAETVSVIASNVVNNADAIFQYYDQNFTGSEASLATPADITQVKLVKIILKIDKDENISPPVFLVETNAQLRNLKEN